jgi:hyperosmotically inducible periplasmic protein
MMKVIKALAALLLLSGLATLPAMARVGIADDKSASTSGRTDAQIQEDVQKALKDSKLKNVMIHVANGVVTLSGSVDLYAYKEEADRKAHHVKGIAAVQNLIEVAGSEVPDEVLQEKLLKKIEYDRVGYGTTPFNAIGVSVHNGDVALSGHAYGPVDKDSALSAAKYMPGVKDVVDEIQVDPVSPMDDQIRLATARAIYGYPPLQKYAIDPGKPIRISVQNGVVSLYGTVDSEADKNIANIQANSVPNVFKVNNYLQVAGEKQKK